jgi:MFS family permease
MMQFRCSREAATWFVAAALAVTMLGTTLPTPLYVLYQQQWGFSTLTGTVIYAAYAGGVVAALLALGRSSDRTGRKPMLLLGLSCATTSDLVFIGAHDVRLLLVARVLSGLSAGIFTGTATAAIIDLAPPAARSRATLLATAANMGGLGAGPLVAGLLASLAPEPLLLPYAAHLTLVGAVAIVLLAVPETVVVSSRLRVQVPRLGVPVEVSGTFLRAALPGFVGFAVLGLFAAIAPVFLRQLLRMPVPALAGGVASAVFIASCIGQIVLVPALGRAALSAGRTALVFGLGLLAVALGTASLLLLLLAATVAGLGQGITFRAGLTQVNEQAPADQRSEVASTFFTVMYAGISIPVVGVGLGASAWGLRPAGIGFCLVMAALALVQPLLPRLRRTWC